jgi:photosystem II stability/assembly factor-like uncharacterized protein
MRGAHCRFTAGLAVVAAIFLVQSVPAFAATRGSVARSSMRADAGGARRKPHDTIAPGFDPRSVAFWTVDRGVLAGERVGCKERCRGRRGEIALTKDGGRTWKVVAKVPRGVSNLWVIADGHGWATVGTRHPRLLRTNNFGRSWHGLAQGAGPSNAAFLDPSTGLGSRSPHDTSLERWHNGKWRKDQSPCGGETIVDISLVQGGEGWIACDILLGAGNDVKDIYRTTDGGDTWTPVVKMSSGHPTKNGLSLYGYMQQISFLPGGDGWLIESRGQFLSTDDGGQSWSVVHGIQRPEIDFGISAWRIDTSTGYALEQGYQGILLERTIDGGRSWRRVAHAPR